MLYYKDDDDITVYFANGDIAKWSSNNVNYNKVHQLCLKENWTEIEILYKLNKAIVDETNTVICKNNEIKINDTVITDVNTPLCNFIKLLQNKGVVEENIEAIKPFITNMFKNPFIDAVTEIYDFCKAMDFEITDDGCFLAYKKVRKDLGSLYDNGATKHKIGEYTEVTLYNTDRTKTCSNGLHFCSKSYLPHYGGIDDTIIIVKINPMDVVSIPVDYNYAKGRCRKYMTVGILNDPNKMLKDIKKEELCNVNNILRNDDTMIPTLMDKVDATAYWMKTLDNDEEKVAKRMNIKVSTVQRNMRKYRERNKLNRCLRG